MSAYNKFLVALAAALGVAGSLASDGLNTADIIAIAAAFVGALGVYYTPNKPAAE